MGNTNATKRYTSFDHGGRVLGHTVQIGASSYGFTYEYNDLAVKTGETNRTYASGLTYAPHGAPDGGTFGPGWRGGYGVQPGGRLSADVQQPERAELP